MPDPAEQDFVIDGEVVTEADFTFREQREVRRLIREELLEDPSAAVELDDLALVDFLPAFVTVFKRRSDPEYSLDQALDLKLADLVQERPTPPAGKRKATTRAGR